MITNPLPPIGQQGNSGVRAILRPPQAAEYIGLKASTLAKRRWRGERPYFIRLGTKSVGYHIAELDAWLADCRRNSTSEND